MKSALEKKKNQMPSAQMGDPAAQNGSLLGQAGGYRPDRRPFTGRRFRPTPATLWRSPSKIRDPSATGVAWIFRLMIANEVRGPAIGADAAYFFTIPYPFLAMLQTYCITTA